MNRSSSLVAGALALLAGCSSDPSRPPADRALDAPFGALEPRLAALDAFAGRRSPVALSMVRHTIEGVPIAYSLYVRAGLAHLTSDERADGGGRRTDSLTALALVRYVPAEWVGNVEVRKERLEPVDAAGARARAGTYLLVHPRCLAGPCTETF